MVCARAPGLDVLLHGERPAVLRAEQHPVILVTRSQIAPLLGATLGAVEIALGIALGLADVAIPAAGSRWEETSYSGFLLGAFALGNVAGGIWFGRRDWKSSPQRRYLVATLLLALALAPPIAATGAKTLAPLLIISGLAYGPATISLFEALDTLAASRATEALTWVTTAGAIGAAAGSAASGWAIERFGLWAPFAAASLILAVAAALGLWSNQQVSQPAGKPGGGSNDPGAA